MTQTVHVQSVNLKRMKPASLYILGIFVCKLKKCPVGTTFLPMFDKSFVESVLTFLLLWWYGNSLFSNEI